MKDLVEQKPLSAAEVKANVKSIQEILEKVMINNVHYGVVPGCGNKPALLKAGAEKIMSTFRLSADPVVEDLSTSDCARYRVTLRLLAVDGTFCGAGVGEASTNEEKYKWRKAICKEEFEATPEDKRRIKWGRDSSKTEQIRTQPADLANTVLKMAKKRAQVDAVLTATAASDLFEQDIDEMDPDLINHGSPATGKPKVAMPQATKPAQQANADIDNGKAGSASADVAQDIIDNMGGVPETEYLTVTQAKTAQVGNFINIKAKVLTVKSRKVGQGKDITDYGVEDADGARVIISKWELCPEGVASGVECYFLNVKVGEYKGTIQYVAQEIMPC